MMHGGSNDAWMFKSFMDVQMMHGGLNDSWIFK